MDRRGRETESQNIFSFTSKCHGCDEAPANNDNCNTSGGQKITQHLREVDEWWSTRCHRGRVAVRKENR